MRCLSGVLMNELLVWRNPQGRSERWDSRLGGREVQVIDNRWKLAVRIAITEVGLALLTVVAVIEVLAPLALPFRMPIPNLLAIVLSVSLFSASCLSGWSFCAGFTVLRGIANLAFCNLFHINVPTTAQAALRVTFGIEVRFSYPENR